MAWRDAGLGDELPRAERDRIGVIVGVGIGGIETIERHHRTLLEKGPERVSPYFIPAAIANMGAGQVAMRLGLRGINYCTTSACASGAHAIGEAMRLVQRGAAEIMVAGGAEAAITPLGVAGFNAMLALSTRNDEPARASRPWDKGRDGFVMGEGAGILVLEERERALARGAHIYAELVGLRRHRRRAPRHAARARRPKGPSGRCARRWTTAPSTRRASATSTPTAPAPGRATRRRAGPIRAVFGAHAERLAVSSTKSMTGHLLGAAGGVEGAITALALARGVLPPTINLDEPDPACDLDYVPHEARRARGRRGPVQLLRLRRDQRHPRPRAPPVAARAKVR